MEPSDLGILIKEYGELKFREGYYNHYERIFGKDDSYDLSEEEYERLIVLEEMFFGTDNVVNKLPKKLPRKFWGNCSENEPPLPENDNQVLKVVFPGGYDINFYPSIKLINGIIISEWKTPGKPFINNTK